MTPIWSAIGYLLFLTSPDLPEAFRKAFWPGVWGNPPRRIASAAPDAAKELAPTYYPVCPLEHEWPNCPPVARRVAGDLEPVWDVPFLRLPEVTRVPVAGDRFAFGLLDGEDRPRPLGRFTFDRPAYFPMPGYDLGGNAHDLPGVLIYEGMRVVIREKGEFDVNFTVAIPDRPVTLRLQLVLVNRLHDGTTALKANEFPGREYTITLPPIELNPVQRTADLDLGPPPLRDTPRLTFHVNHQGHSLLLQDFEDHARMINQAGAENWRKDERAVPRAMEMGRDGVARFGTTPPRLFDR